MAERGVLDLSEKDLNLVRSILQRYVPEESVYVFGSRATGRTRYLSDLDLLLDRTEPLDPAILRDLTEAFDESDLPIEVDVIDLSTVTETFRRRVLAERIPFPMSSEIRLQQHEVHA
jgi:predicted nucleotidyltransferase